MKRKAASRSNLRTRKARTKNVARAKSGSHRKSAARGKAKRQVAPRGRVFLEHDAFVNLVLAATEAYRRETYGILLGARRRGMVYVQSAAAYQTARRKPLSVTVPGRRWRILRSVLRHVKRPTFLGEFHSHVGYGADHALAALSSDDVQNVADQEIQLLMTVRPLRAARRWRHNADGSLSGTAGPYFVRMRAFQMRLSPNGNPLTRVARLRCKHALTNMLPRSLRN